VAEAEAYSQRGQQRVYAGESRRTTEPQWAMKGEEGEEGEEDEGREQRGQRPVPGLCQV
jgi:hypothetical protein